MKISFDVINLCKMGKTYYTWAHELLRQQLFLEVIIYSCILWFKNWWINWVNIELCSKYTFCDLSYLWFLSNYTSISHTYTTLAIFWINIIIDALNIDVKSSVVAWPHIWVLCPAKYLSRCRTSSSVYCPRPNFCGPTLHSALWIDCATNQDTKFCILIQTVLL